MRLVILESPHAGRGSNWLARLWDRLGNAAYARACLRDCLMRGEAPIASHVLLARRGVLDDAVPAARALGIEAGLAWGRVAEATVVYADRGIRPGMLLGASRARREDRPVEERRLGGRWGSLA